MAALEYLKNKDFLKELDNTKNKFYWVKIEVLDSDELPIQSIEGRVQPGSSINIDGNSSVRRTCNISFIAEEEENDLTDVENLLSATKKIKIYEGIKNDINENYDSIIWFQLGVFVIVQPSISHSNSGCIINLSCKDKMCLLNGECAGGLPTSITFHEYDQIVGRMKTDGDPKLTIEEPNNYTVYEYIDEGVTKYKIWSKEYDWTEVDDDSLVGERVSVPQRIYDIIQTLVCNYGGESLSKIMINDIPLELKQIVRYTGNKPLYYNRDTGMYTTDESYLNEEGSWKAFEFNDDVGYVYTDFTYPGNLISNIGENVCSVLEKIKNTLGNYEYFYDIEGNFVFQEVKNYLNNSYDPAEGYRLDDNGKDDGTGHNREIQIKTNGLSILDGVNYKIDFHSNTKSVYTFNEGCGLITSFNNNPSYTNLKNDFHIWGENEDGYAIHYHIAIKNKPNFFNTYNVVYLTDDAGNYTGGIRLKEDDDRESEVVKYVPADWRAELYLQGLTKWQNQIRPDIYEQELLDLFDMIYDFKEQKFKADIVNHPNDLQYFFDYLEPIDRLYDCSVDVLKPKVMSYQQDKLKRLYNTDIPDTIIVNLSMGEAERERIIDRCEREGQPYSNVVDSVYSKLSIGTIGYTAEETARTLLYQYTNYNESITIQSIPIYYLDVNSRITVQDKKTGIYGDYIIKSISLPLNAESTMSISATKALERI